MVSVTSGSDAVFVTTGVVVGIMVAGITVVGMVVGMVVGGVVGVGDVVCDRSFFGVKKGGSENKRGVGLYWGVTHQSAVVVPRLPPLPGKSAHTVQIFVPYLSKQRWLHWRWHVSSIL
jgi:hypothetical protein